MKDNPASTKRRRYDAALRVEALRLFTESRSTQARRIDPKRIYKLQKEAPTPVAAAELRQLRAANRRQAQELEI